MVFRLTLWFILYGFATTWGKINVVRIFSHLIVCQTRRDAHQEVRLELLRVSTETEEWKT